MVEPLRHRQTKGAETDMPGLPPPRHIPTLPTSDLGMRRQVKSTKGAAAGPFGFAPSPLPAHQTGRADFPHPAFRLVSCCPVHAPTRLFQVVRRLQVEPELGGCSEPLAEQDRRLGGNGARAGDNLANAVRGHTEL